MSYTCHAQSIFTDYFLVFESSPANQPINLRKKLAMTDMRRKTISAPLSYEESNGVSHTEEQYVYLNIFSSC